MPSRRLVPALAVASCLLLAAVSAGAAAFDAGLAGFALEFRGLTLPYRTLAVFVMPGETVEFAVAADTDADRAFTLAAPVGAVEADGGRRWRWTPPAAAQVCPLVFSDDATGEAITINAFVMVPAAEVRGGMLNGYRIGDYPATPLKGLEIYLPPAGFVEVQPGDEDIPVSPHFTLGQFLCKQEGGHPKYLVLKTRLLLKLELLLQKVNEAGHRYDTFAVMSGYRTPYYNKLIGNVTYSRHVWGGAADIYLDDDPRDAVMDDLNGDGRFDVRDAAVLFQLIDALSVHSIYAPFVGGLGQYRKTSNHGPFVHVDVRGFRARWGD